MSLDTNFNQHGFDIRAFEEQQPPSQREEEGPPTNDQLFNHQVHIANSIFHPETWENSNLTNRNVRVLTQVEGQESISEIASRTLDVNFHATSDNIQSNFERNIRHDPDNDDDDQTNMFDDDYQRIPSPNLGQNIELCIETELNSHQAEVDLNVRENEVNSTSATLDIGINTDNKVPPQKLLREAIKEARKKPGFDNASTEIKSSLDQELQNDNPNFKVETELNSHGVLLYKVNVNYTIEVKNGAGEVIKMTLNRNFYSNATNEKEALLAIYGVAKGIEQQAIANPATDSAPSDDALEQKLFTITYERDLQSQAILGINTITGDKNVALPPLTSEKTTFSHDIDKTGQVRFRAAKQNETGKGQALSEQARLLRSNIEFTDIPILDRLKQQKIDHKNYISKQVYEAHQLKEESHILKEQLVKDNLLQWMAKNKKTLDEQIDNILSGKADPKDLTLSKEMKAYLPLRQKYAEIEPLVNELENNRETIEKFTQIRENLLRNQELSEENQGFINAVRTKMNIDPKIPVNAATIQAIIDKRKVQQYTLLNQQVKENHNLAQLESKFKTKLEKLDNEYTEARSAALQEHQDLFENLGRMQGIQNELGKRKGELKKLQIAIQNQTGDDMTQSNNQIAEALSEIDKQIGENAKILSVQNHLGKLFGAIPSPVYKMNVSADPYSLQA